MSTQNRTYKILIVFTLWCFSAIAFALPVNELPKTILEGTISDKTTHEGLPGAGIYIPDLKIGAVTNENGKYKITNLPQSKLLVQVSFIGYQTLAITVDLSQINQMNFELTPSPIEVSEVVVTGSAGSSDIKRSSVAISTIKGKDLLLIPSTNLVNALTSVPGVSAITTGGAVSKPVIRGLGYNHVVILDDGVRQEGNQWGDEHGLEVDQYSIDHVEILKGPASLFYGSDALGGVINFREPDPDHTGHVDSEIASFYSTNNKLTSTTAMNEGNLNGFIWKLRGTYKNAASFQTPTEYVYNSGFNEQNFNAMFGVNHSWGYSHLHFSSYDAHIGAIDGNRDPLTGKFLNNLGEIVSSSDAQSRHLDVPFQVVTHQKVSLVNNFIVNHTDQLKVNIGFQTNNRKEYSESADTPGLYFHLNTLSYDIKYLREANNGWEPAAGFSGMTQTNANRGVDFLIPDYRLQDLGGFFYLKKSFDKLTLNAGLRYNHRYIKSDALIQDNSGTPTELFKSFTTNLSAFSGAVGTTYKINSHFDFKANLGRGYRAPNIAELSANGVHEGTFRYELGDNSLKPETSLQLDGELSFHTNRTSVILSGFINSIDNYIYQRNLNGETKTINNTSFPVYRYVQGNSRLTGAELSADMHPFTNIHFENSLAYVYGENRKTGKPLPFIPPLHTRHTLRWELPERKGFFHNPYVSGNVQWVFAQNRFDEFETRTGGYVLLGISAGSSFMVAHNKPTFYVSCSNLSDTRYYDHLSRLKYNGIYNPGRDITFGLIWPLEKAVE
ncbi:MAG: TonB-dependent receptor [Bacteroidota bacterium]|nr:TonB-dependent receptor [Bacteroidota bacterium]